MKPSSEKSAVSAPRRSAQAAARTYSGGRGGLSHAEAFTPRFSERHGRAFTSDGDSDKAAMVTRLGVHCVGTVTEA